MKRLLWSVSSLLFLAGTIHAQQKGVKESMVTKNAKTAIVDGLAALAKQQNEDGSFGTGPYKHNVGITGLAGLAFLSAKEGENHGQVVSKAVRFLLTREDLKRPGFLQDPQSPGHGPMYGHAFAVLFLADAHELTEDKALQKDIRATLERSVKIIIESQNNEGGWRYQPIKGDADLTVTACQVVALRAARDLGIGVPRKTLDKAAGYIKDCQDKDSGGFRYQKFGGPAGFARSAAGITALERLGVNDQESLKKGNDYLRRIHGKQGLPDNAIHYSYGHYYAAKAMWYAGDHDWRAWYPPIRDELVRTQKMDHQWGRGMECPHFATSVALIVLQMPNEKLPSLMR